MRWMARGEPGVPPGDAWLAEAEATRAQGMRFTKRRTEYLLRRYAGKCAVAATLGIPQEPAGLARIALLNRPTGAPYVEVDGRRLGLDVSLTDRAGWAVCLVGEDLSAVGCDLEIVEHRSEGFVSDFLTPAEQLAVAGAAEHGGPDARDALANLIWSAKESALKVQRTGLRADTRSVEVSVAGAAQAGGAGPVVAVGEHRAGVPPASTGWLPLEVATSRGTLPGWWRRDGLFLLTVVASGQGGAPPEELEGSAPLIEARPTASWLTHPLAD